MCDVVTEIYVVIPHPECGYGRPISAWTTESSANQMRSRIAATCVGVRIEVIQIDLDDYTLHDQEFQP